MPGTFEDEYHDIIGKARHGLGLGVREAAKLSGLSESEIQGLESGEPAPAPDRLARLAPVLGLSAGKLVQFACAPAPPRAVDPKGAIVLPLPRTASSANGYAIGCLEKKDCALVDPGPDPGEIRAALDRLGLKPVILLLTHGHSDHTQGVEAATARLGIPAFALTGERPMLGEGRIRFLESGSVLEVGKLRLEFLEVPGHTPGGGVVRSAAARVACTGDILFARSIGRPWVSGRAYSRYLDRIRNSALGLPEDSLLCPGHGPLTNVSDELNLNPFFA